MQTSEQVTDLITALAAAQGEFPSIGKNKKAEVQTKAGRNYSYGYADISVVLAAVIPVLSKHKIVLTQPTILDGDNMIIRTYLWHTSGQWMYAEYSVCSIVGDHQAMGAALTYARRYAICTLLGIAAEEDLDGQTAAKSESRRAPPPPKQEMQEPPNDEVFTRFRLNVEEGLKKINDAVALKAAETITWKRMGEFKCSDEQYAAMEGIFQHKVAEVGPGTVESKPKRKAPPPTQGRSAEPYVKEGPRSYETQRKLFIEQVDGLSDYDEVASCWETMINAYSKDFFPPDMSEAQALLRSYEKKLAP
jgi:hypothetical protein